MPHPPKPLGWTGLLIAGTFGILSTACASPGVGDVLSAQAMRQLQGHEVQLAGGSRVIVLKPVPARINPKTPANTAGAAPADAHTLVVNPQGMVGISFNQVVIARLKTADVQTALQSMQLDSSATVQHYPHLDITRVRFSSFEKALQAQAVIQAALPKAQVTLPINYQKPHTP